MMLRWQDEIIEMLESALTLARAGKLHQLFLATDQEHSDIKYHFRVMLCANRGHCDGLLLKIVETVEVIKDQEDGTARVRSH
jgi:hypothetical protein